ncbi:MAG: mannose-6-phosphate isomerase, class I [Vicinamibacterales bacterium]
MTVFSVSDAIEQLAREPRPLELTGPLQPYAWGGTTFLPSLTGVEWRDGTPAAEWWLGAHPSASASVMVGNSAWPLNTLLHAAPAQLLGADVHGRFGPRLPYLLKILDVRQMLSIQAHPSKSQAEEGFARENAAGIPVDAATRNYRDDNHKPEAQVALTPFWMLAGFRSVEEMRSLLNARPELRPLAERLDTRDADTIAALYAWLFAMDEDEADTHLTQLADRLLPAYRAGSLSQATPDFWAARALEQFRSPRGTHDRGVFAIYLMNLVRLEPGEGTFLGSGVIHAYLEGRCVEIMANSDNVLRGGLTPKHVDVEELKRVVTFRSSMVDVLRGHAQGAEWVYAIPAEEFGLSRLSLGQGRTVACGSSHAPEILVTLDGAAHLAWESGTMHLPAGRAAFVPAQASAVVSSDDGATVFRATMPRA